MILKNSSMTQDEIQDATKAVGMPPVVGFIVSLFCAIIAQILGKVGCMHLPVFLADMLPVVQPGEGQGIPLYVMQSFQIAAWTITGLVGLATIHTWVKNTFQKKTTKKK